MAGGVDLLSELPDDLLCRVLHFAPLREAASTTSLSRRWRTPLWLSSGAINLEKHVKNYDDIRDREAFLSQRNAFVLTAVAALDAAQVTVTRLTLRLDSDGGGHVVPVFLHNYSDKDDHVVPLGRTALDVVLSHPRARRVEELKLVSASYSCDMNYTNYYDYEDREIFRVSVGFYTLALDSLPWETLRVLELINCRGLYKCKASTVVLPRLSTLRLRHCAQNLRSLQHIIDAAPVLAAVILEYVIVDTTDEAHYNHGFAPPRQSPHRLRCPAATMMVLARCRWQEMEPGSTPYGYDKDRPVAVEFDTPRLRHFSYKGLLRPFSFSLQLPELEQVDLCCFSGYVTRDKDPNRDLATFWRFARSFTSTKEMRLRVSYLEDIAVLSTRRQVELLPTFHHLQRLEVRGIHRPKGKREAVAMANLLWCCPVLRDLCINLTMEHDDASNYLERKYRSNRDMFVDGPDTCGDSEPTPVLPEGDVDASDVSGLSRLCSVECSARRVGLQFRFEKSDCLGVRIRRTKEELYNLIAAWKEEYNV